MKDPDKKQTSQVTENYLEFKSQEEFNEHIKPMIQEYVSKINDLENENKSLKVKDIEIEKLNSRIEVFTDHILNKYEVKATDLDRSSFDYNSYDHLEKSILKQLELKNINYKKSDEVEQPTKTDKLPKIYL